MKLRIALAALVLSAAPALAQNCPGYPYDLTNGQTADATQVMANFNAILACANSQLAHNGVNSDITQLLNVTNLAFAPVNSNITEIDGLTTPLAVTEGGTGASSASPARTNLGLGTAAIENLGGDIIDDGGTPPNNNLTIGNSGVVAGSYTNPAINISADGRITSASSGSGPSSFATVRAWVTFNDVAGTVTVFSSYNVSSVSRVGAGQYTVQTSGGVSFSGGGLVCTAKFSGGDPATCSMNGNAITGLNPAPQVQVSDGGTLTDVDNICSVIIVGAS
jgi:hypothetical protein